MAEFIEREAALTADFKISVKRLDKRIKTAQDAVQAYANYIASLPAADVKPVVRGEWITEPPACNDDLLIRCSVCKRIMRDGREIGMIKRYCPNCGADMRGDNDG